MIWTLSHRADERARVIADRHYNRQKIGAPQFVPPDRCLVLLADTHDAFWITSFPFAQYVKHAWAGAWMCSAFRREPGCPYLASRMIRAAVACTRWKYGYAPSQGMVTFVDRDKTKSKRDPGYCYLMAGFEPVGFTKAGLVALQMRPERMPLPQAPHGVA